MEVPLHRHRQACSAHRRRVDRSALRHIVEIDIRERLPANHPLQRRNLGFVFLEEISSLSIFVQGADFILLNPDPDQLPRDIMPLGKPLKGLSGNELLCDLPFERDAVGTLSGHGFHPLKAQLPLSIHLPHPVRPQGRTPY